MGNWYRRDVDDALDDVLALTPEEHGIYDRVVLLIHRRGGTVPDDDVFVSGWCRCEPRLWRRVRARLIALEKLYAVDDGLRSPRADPEIAETRRRHAAAQAAGRASALSRKSGPNEINDLGPAPVAKLPRVADDPPLSDAMPAITRAEAEAQVEIAEHLDRRSPFEMQDMVAALMQAMGYLTEVAPPGPDGGTDVLGYRDPLGPPCLRTQVKHRTAPVSREAIAALRGILHGDETGLFVSLSGFTPEAAREAQGETPIRLVDREDFIALWIRHHDALPHAARDMMRLKAVHFLDRYSAISSATSRFGAECVIAPDDR